MLVNVVLKVTKTNKEPILVGEVRDAVNAAREQVQQALRYMGDDVEYDFEVVHAKVEE